MLSRNWDIHHQTPDTDRMKNICPRGVTLHWQASDQPCIPYSSLFWEKQACNIKINKDAKETFLSLARTFFKIEASWALHYPLYCEPAPISACWQCYQLKWLPGLTTFLHVPLRISPLLNSAPWSHQSSGGQSVNSPTTDQQDQRMPLTLILHVVIQSIQTQTACYHRWINIAQDHVRSEWLTNNI